ncbi:rho GTPase-activating protein 20-like isoform X3 [Pomacea canaliculata]|uniref:rho GTPase-activating protein 20-like isoform X3 n=1 Tax=Pomacea canaliculata TaxID=400727 RepID=UPI000D73F9D0|nr:rho GTPase-activating protein 20-like isoform X3 [Pomacea canaliculata]
MRETETKDYKLWVWWAKEASPYPLIGHETPFSIKLSHVREVSRSRGEDIDKMTQADLAAALEDDEPANLKCDFVLSQKKSPKKHSLEETSHKGQKKPKRDKLLNIFKRAAAREDKTNNNISSPLGKLFGHPLNSVVENDNLPPKPIVDLLTVLFREGPETVGILRKSPNIKMCREIREKLDQERPCARVKARHLSLALSSRIS